MKVLITASTYPNEYEKKQPAFVKELAEELAKKEHLEIYTLIPHAPGIPKKINENGLTRLSYKYFLEKFETLAYPAILPNIKQNPLLIFIVPFLLVAQFIATLAAVKKYKIDYIYSHWFIPQGLISGFVSLLIKNKHVFTFHTADFHTVKLIPVFGGITYKILAWLFRILVRRMSRITVVSRRSLEKIKEQFSDEEWKNKIKPKVKVIPMGIKLSEYSELFNPKKIDFDSHKSIYSIGRLAEKKGIKYLLEGFKLAHDEDKDLRLNIIGDGPERKRLENISEKLGLYKAVNFTGYLTGKEKLEKFKNCGVFVLPSVITKEGDAEGLPVVLMESLAAGNLSIVSNVSGGEEVVDDGVNGWLVDPMNPEQIAEKLLAIQKVNPDILKEIRMEAWETGTRFSLDKIGKEHDEWLFN